MKNTNPTGLFDEHFLLERLTKLKDPLVKLNSLINWELFRPTLDRALVNTTKDKSKGGRPPFDNILMFKILILQSIYNLSDDQIEYQIHDRRSFMRFLGLKASDKVPDSKTVWLFREKLVQNELMEELFSCFHARLEEQGLFTQEGRMVDATFVEVPKQRNTRDENKAIKAGEKPEGWSEHKQPQKDTDARWTKKNNENFYGYKNHVKSDRKSKLILSYEVTHAAVHDSQVLKDLLDSGDAGLELHADSAYSGKKQKKVINNKKMKSRVHEKGKRGKPLTEKQKKKNTEKSRIRATSEHIFGFMENSMNQIFTKVIGYQRVALKIGLQNLTYNIFRSTQLKPTL